MAAANVVLPAERGFARMQSEVKVNAGGTPVEEIHAAHAKLTATFNTGRTKSYEWRLRQLQGIRGLLSENSDQVSAAITSDLGRPKLEAFIADVASVISEVDHSIKHLQTWMKPEAVSTPMLQQPGRSKIIREPKGIMLQIAPWNFPVNLSLMGLIAGLAAGNCCLLKPSEIAPASEKLLKDLLPRYCDPEAVIVVTGGVAETTVLLKLRWDHILYTGNGMVARIVAKAAAEHLTPCTLELGGKSPTVVLPGANLAVASRRILNGKCLNSGQICIAPDYILCHESIEEQLVKELRNTLNNWFGADAGKSPSFGRIINGNHFRRIRDLIDSADGEKIQQGTMDESTKFMPPTLVRGPSTDCSLMTEEIFGPVLPILKMKSLDAIVDHINAGEKPLAMYLFGPEAQADEIISRTSSGGVCVNDTIFHIANPDLPFGGVGGSGMGRYHGKWGFDEFSHVRSVMYRATWIDPAQRYPPYTETNLKMMEKLMVGPLLPPGAKKAAMAIGAVGVGLAIRSRM